MIYPVELSKLYAEYEEEYVEAFRKTLEKGIFLGGEEVAAFEQDVAAYLSAKYVIGCGNGTHALQLALMANDIGNGDEVITVANTYYATVRAIVDTGAEPIFCDVNKYGLMDTDKIEELITERTKAVLPVHLYGAPVDIDRIRKICDRYELVLIEDCAHAFGSLYNERRIGSGSYCACFSLYPTKNLGAMGDAGIIATDSEGLANRIRSIRYFTSDPNRNVFTEKSLHSRIDTMQAALLRVSLRHIDEWNLRRISNAQNLIRLINGKAPYVESLGWDGVVPYVFPVLTMNQDRFMESLHGKGIIGQLHYKPNLHKIAHLTKKDYCLPVTERLNRQVVSVPIAPTVTAEEIEYIAECVLTADGLHIGNDF